MSSSSGIVINHHWSSFWSTHRFAIMMILNSSNLIFIRWVILTATWFLSAGLKWAQESISRFSFVLINHLLLWCSNQSSSIVVLQVQCVVSLPCMDSPHASGLKNYGIYQHHSCWNAIAMKLWNPQCRGKIEEYSNVPQTVGVLMLRGVDGDSVSGLCQVQFLPSSQILAYFVFWLCLVCIRLLIN